MLRKVRPLWITIVGLLALGILLFAISGGFGGHGS
jgi:hypothetical protein